jgi:hypothetical protein
MPFGNRELALPPHRPSSTSHDVEKSETPLSQRAVILSEGRRGDRSRRICGCLWDSQKPHNFAKATLRPKLEMRASEPGSAQG